MFQSTFPRRERRDNSSYKIPYLGVSIHVPAKGTTTLFDVSARYRGVSIHVPAKGTTSDISSQDDTQWFQSTFPRRERPLTASIATQKYCFNPRSREGNDGEFMEKYGKQGVFQSTFPRRERQLLRQIVDGFDLVSIHVPAKGTTSQRETKFAVNAVSIHVPA